MSKWVKKTHKMTARVIGYALTIGTFEAWASVKLILQARLKPHERAALAYAALSSMDERDAYEVASLALFGTYRERAVK